MIVTANKLWYNGELAVGMCPASINCDQLVGITPRDAYLTPMAGGSCCGGGSYCGDPMYNLSLSKPVPFPAGTLQGVWLEFRGGGGFGMMVDAISAQSVVDSCNDCCNAVAAITPRYNGILPSIPPPVPATYTFTRTDNGDWYAFNRASLQYYGDYIPGTFNRTSYTSGVSTYSFSSNGIPVFVAGDTAGTLPNRVFTSNTAPTLAGSNVFNIDISVNGTDYVAHGGTTLAALKTAIDAVTGVSALGTTAVVGSTITLTSPSVTQAVITIGQQAP